MSIKHPCHTPESVSKAKLFCHECNFLYKTKKSFKNHMSKIHFNPKTYNCDTCEEKFTDKCEFDTHNSEQKHNQDEPAIQISSVKTKSHFCEDDTCDSCLSYWLAKAQEISMGLAIS